MKAKIVLGALFAWSLMQGALAGGPEVLKELLAKARSLKSYHYKISGTGIMDPKDSGFIVKTKMANSAHLWAKREGGRTLLCETGKLELIPLEYPGAINSTSNVLVFDGRDNYIITYQEQMTNAEHLHDPKRTCRLFTDAETLLTKLKEDKNAGYLGRRTVSNTDCQVYESTAQYFAFLMAAKAGTVEIAVDARNGLPVRLALKLGTSTNIVVFEDREVNIEIGGDRFKAPTGLKYQVVEPDGLGGWHRLTE